MTKLAQEYLVGTHISIKKIEPAPKRDRMTIPVEEVALNKR
jgi:hypothetical protein